MHRIDAPGFAPGNLFTNGNPNLGVAATQVSDEWLNDVQENIADIIEFSGGTLVKADYTQLRVAVQALISTGGGGQTSVTLDNNSGPLDVTGLVFDKLNIKAAEINVDIERFTDTQNVQETGIIRVVHDTQDDVWRINLISNFDDAGTVFSVTSGGQIQYTTDDLTGANYSGTIRITGTKTFAQ